jgi:peptide deformylase
MKVPIISYGNVGLRQICRDVDLQHPDLETTMLNLSETLHAANGVGLAAPQINEPLKMFIVDTQQIYALMKEDDRPAYFPGCKGIRDIFINARIRKRSADTFIDQEGCLSIPTLFEEIERNWSVEIEYYNRFFEKQTRIFSGFNARVIQHEIDHTKGILFIDHLSPLKKKLLTNKLCQISEGKILSDYAMQFTW